MDRIELRDLAAESAVVQVIGRIFDFKRTNDGEFVDVLLKHCKVRKIEMGKPLFTHDEIKTDHVWIRLPGELADADERFDVPPEMRSIFKRGAMELWKQVAIAGEVGPYVDSHGKLGIGIIKPVPVVPVRKLVAELQFSLDAFQEAPWELGPMQAFVRKANKIKTIVSTRYVIADQESCEMLHDIDFWIRKVERTHKAERRARLGGKTAVSMLPGLNPALDLAMELTRNGSSLDHLQALAKFEGS